MLLVLLIVVLLVSLVTHAQGAAHPLLLLVMPLLLM